MPSLAEAVIEGLEETRRGDEQRREAEEVRRVQQAARFAVSQRIETARREREDRLAAQALAHRKADWRKKGRAGLVSELVAVGWRVDATDLNRLVLRRGEGMLALSLPFSPADACELEDRHGWAFLPWL